MSLARPRLSCPLSVLTVGLHSFCQGTDAFVRQPYHQLRHPMMFYYGHPAVLYINKFRVAGLLEDGIDLFFEQVRNHSQAASQQMLAG